MRALAGIRMLRRAAQEDRETLTIASVESLELPGIIKPGELPDNIEISELVNLKEGKRIPFCCFNLPAIYLYTKKKTAVNLKLNFKNGGFMTKSVPPYNDGWRVFVNPDAPYHKISLQYPSFKENPTSFLDYDGVRIGDWQDCAGWLVETDNFSEWLRDIIPSLHFSKSEGEDFFYWVSRLVSETNYHNRDKAKYLSIFPQTTEIVNKAVELDIEPEPDSVWRLWLYIQKTDESLKLDPPDITSPSREGFAVIETGILVDYE